MDKARRRALAKRTQEHLRANLEEGKGETEITRFSLAEEGKKASHLLFEEGKEGKVTFRNHVGPCHSALNRYTKVQALVTSPNVAAWRDSSLWCAGRHHDIPCWDFESYFEEACHWWNWLMHESPWRDAYVTKPDVEEAGTHGVVIDVNMPSNLAMFAIIATRHPHEYPQRVRAWSRGVRMGGDPLGMALLQECFSVHEGIHGANIMNFDRVGGGIHDMFDTSKITDEGIRQFLAWEPIHLNPPLTVSGNFSGIHLLWDSSSEWRETTDTFVRRGLNVIKPKKRRMIKTWEWDKGIVSKNVNSIDFDYGVERLAALSKEVMHEYS